MSVLTIGYKPNLTKEQTREVFAKHFAGTYKIMDSTGAIKRDFMMIKNSFVGVGVRLDQEADVTKLVYSVTGLRSSPLFWLGGLGRLASVLLAPLIWSGQGREVAQFIKDAPEFW